VSVAPWIEVPDYETAINEVSKTIFDSFRARNIGIAAPQREVRMLEGGAPPVQEPASKTATPGPRQQSKLSPQPGAPALVGQTVPAPARCRSRSPRGGQGARKPPRIAGVRTGDDERHEPQPFFERLRNQVKLGAAL
jgi:hypothetical protein